MDSNKLNVNMTEIIKRSIKFVLVGFLVALAARYIPKYRMDLKEIVMIAATASIGFAVIELYAPTINKKDS
jgi:pyruvate/2-oxoacid:ferredoxin oxidoreductase beta subunit